jgi:predicted lysophospholipase L1 biosynthesis ABC-type transport system permease subunit
MDRQSVVTVLSLLVGVIGIFLQYRQIQLMQTASPPKRSTSKLWWRAPAVVALATLTVLNLSVLGIAIWQRPHVAALSVSGWGGMGLPARDRK